MAYARAPDFALKIGPWLGHLSSFLKVKCWQVSVGSPAALWGHSFAFAVLLNLGQGPRYRNCCRDSSHWSAGLADVWTHVVWAYFICGVGRTCFVRVFCSVREPEIEQLDDDRPDWTEIACLLCHANYFILKDQIGSLSCKSYVSEDAKQSVTLVCADWTCLRLSLSRTELKIRRQNL